MKLYEMILVIFICFSVILNNVMILPKLNHIGMEILVSVVSIFIAIFCIVIAVREVR